MRVSRFFLLGSLIVLLAACGGASTGESQPFTSADGRLSFTVPAGWTVQESDGQIFLGTSAEIVQAAANGSVATAPGQFAASILMFPASDVSRLDGDAGAAEVLTIVFASLASASGIEGSPGPMTGVTIGSYNAARMEGVIGNLEVLLFGLDINPEVTVVLIGSSTAGEMNDFSTMLEDIAASITYTPSTDREATGEAGS